MHEYDLVLASKNRNKAGEVNEILSSVLGDRIRILSLGDIGFNEDIAEGGKTFEENSLIKAAAVARLGYIGIADDSGLCVDCLGGAPGIFSARYASDNDGNSSDEMNRAKLLETMKNVPEKDRSARFVCAASIAIPESVMLEIPEKYRNTSHKTQGFPEERTAVVRGECGGRILFSETGNEGFGYDCIFFSDDLKKSFGSAVPKEKNLISHRYRAFCRMAEVISEIFKQR